MEKWKKYANCEIATKTEEANISEDDEVMKSTSRQGNTRDAEEAFGLCLMKI